MIFERPGPANTAQTIDIALQAAKAHGIRHIVVASNTGETALLLTDADAHVTVVTHVQGFVKPGENELSADMRASLQAKGMDVLTTSHALSGVERGISRSHGGMYPAELIAHTLRMLGQGTKVCVEIAVMALDAGLIPHGEVILAIGGSGRGADTAALLTPAHAQAILDTRVHEILCKPR